MSKVHVKTNDTVIVISGESKGVKGKVIAVSPEEGKVIVEKANIQTKHVKARKQTDPSGIQKVEGAMHASKVLLYCDNCKQGVRAKTLVSTEEQKDGTKKTVKKRVCAKCGKEL